MTVTKNNAVFVHSVLFHIYINIKRYIEMVGLYSVSVSRIIDILWAFIILWAFVHVFFSVKSVSLVIIVS